MQPQPTAPAPSPGGPDAGAAAPLTLDSMLAAASARDDRPHRLVSSQQLQLSRIVELEIIPRLMLLHRSQPLSLREPGPPLVLTEAHVHALSELAVHDDAERAIRYVRSLIEAGATQEQVFLDLLAPCARHLGELWEEDVYNFSQVTIGLWRLQRVLHEESIRPDRVVPFDANSRRILLAAVPGAQHTFGVTMAAEFFSRAGWDVDCEPKSSWHDIGERLARQWFDVFGLSISASEGLPQIASAILDMRKAAANPRLYVMVGGPMAAQVPDLARLCGADAMASEARVAVSLAQDSLSPNVRRA
ncbi:cobalamin B12-binding domain-containing protein [Roseateles cellulosilyticus]|uniref:Cobalamin B12-binding domain-containing protein n=1 Tax=Pelomonas cellulosilytica TaxID=2906762 RepID=A0ABS8XUA8_9BURK|nr:cobalamin B12-binding domain-containing protein [Pelomonas sp. P8]MCE4554416.1 cobalamin B12-binding domain-containing protein [Pelomonas sp. P8]